MNKSARQEVGPQLRYLLDDLTLTAGFVIGRNTDLLAWNAMAAALVTDFGRIPEEQRNYVRLLFTEPVIRVLYRDGEHMARLAVSHLRMDSRRNPHDPRLAVLVEELSALDPQFRLWWTSHDVAVRAGGTRLLRHPMVGDLAFQRSTFICAEDPEQQLVVWIRRTRQPDLQGPVFPGCRHREGAGEAGLRHLTLSPTCPREQAFRVGRCEGTPRGPLYR
ncbi:hypothetical protein ACRJ4B_15785 [Streptomyces sp. GTA36]